MIKTAHVYNSKLYYGKLIINFITELFIKDKLTILLGFPSHSKTGSEKENPREFLRQK